MGENVQGKKREKRRARGLWHMQQHTPNITKQSKKTQQIKTLSLVSHPHPYHPDPLLLFDALASPQYLHTFVG